MPQQIERATAEQKVNTICFSTFKGICVSCLFEPRVLHFRFAEGAAVTEARSPPASLKVARNEVALPSTKVRARSPPCRWQAVKK